MERQTTDGKTLEDYRQLVGVRPEIDRTPLSGTEYSNSSITVFKFTYPVHPGYWEKDLGSGYVVVPKNKNGKVVFAAHQHGGTWKLGKEQVFGPEMPDSDKSVSMFAGTENQIYGKELVDLGYTVIASDALCFGDRCYPDNLPLAYGFNPGELPEDFWYACNIERQAHEYELARGRNLASRLYYDDSGAITAAQHVLGEELSGIGVVGHSMGGQRTFLLTMFDDRVKAGVSNCGLISVNGYQRLNSQTKNEKPEGRIFHNFALAVPGLVSEGLDYEESIKLLPENKRLLVLYNTEDRIFPVEAVQPVIDSADSIRDSNILLIGGNGGHEFQEHKRKLAYRFLDQNL